MHLSTQAIPEATLQTDEGKPGRQKSFDSLGLSRHPLRASNTDQLSSVKFVPGLEQHKSVEDAAGSWTRPNDSFTQRNVSPTFLTTSSSIDDRNPTDPSMYATSPTGYIVSEDTKPEAPKLIPEIDTTRIPCPGLCGATFSTGVGGLVGEYLFDTFCCG